MAVHEGEDLDNLDADSELSELSSETVEPDPDFDVDAEEAVEAFPLLPQFQLLNLWYAYVAWVARLLDSCQRYL